MVPDLLNQIPNANGILANAADPAGWLPGPLNFGAFVRGSLDLAVDFIGVYGSGNDYAVWQTDD